MKPTPEFSRPIPVDALEDGLEVAETADAAECAALTARFGVPEVKSLSLRGALHRWGPGGWRLEGVARAELVQICVLTLERIDTELEEPFQRFYAPAAALPEAARMLGEDEPDPLGDGVDVGEAAAEAAALAIDPYPRRPGVDFDGARFGPPGSAPLTDEAARPFAALASLRRAAGRGEGS
jgi:hypothetical protein